MVSPLDIEAEELLDCVADAARAGDRRADWLLDQLLEVDEPGVILRLACTPYVERACLK